MALNVSSTCRICLDSSAHCNIFSSYRSHNSTKVACCEMMSSVFSLPVRQGDRLPVNICRKCFSKLTCAYKLKILAENSLKQLQSCLAGHSPSERKSQNFETEIKLEFNIKKEDTSIEENGSGSRVCPEEGGGEDDDDPRLSDGSYSKEDNVPLRFSEYKREKVSPYASEGENTEKLVAKGKVGRRKPPDSETSCEPAVCHLCGKLVKNLSVHKLSHSVKRRELPCPECPKVFACYSSRKKHLATFHLGQRFYCQMCNKYYKRGQDHMKLMHSSAPRPHACPQCHKTFLTRTHLKLHVSSHTKERPFSCPVCQKVFRNKSNRDIHRRSVHEKERNFICQYCSRGFFSSTELKKHLWCHTNEKNYRCKECGKCFARSSNMRLHEKKHTGVKDVHCIVCNKGFYNKGALKTHMVTHSQEKKHECRYCGLKFGRSYTRNKHQKTAHENKM